jgi:hypothetical protein
MKARELTMAAHSDPVNLPEGDADELPRTMVPSCSFTGIVAKMLVQLGSRYIGCNTADVPGDTSEAELALIADGARGGSCLGVLVGLSRAGARVVLVGLPRVSARKG